MAKMAMMVIVMMVVVLVMIMTVVTANPGLEGWKSVIGIFEEAKIPFTVMMGNHDAEIVSKDEIYAMLSKSPYFMGDSVLRERVSYGG